MQTIIARFPVLVNIFICDKAHIYNFKVFEYNKRKVYFGRIVWYFFSAGPETADI